MRQVLKLVAVCVVLALAAPIQPPLASVASAASKSSATASRSKSRNALRQFTGVVTAFDKNSITVEKGGKKPKTMVFARDVEMKTTGEIETDVRVTVYYREEDGRAIARRVVVRTEGPGSGGGR
jgi:hypothetical protein